MHYSTKPLKCVITLLSILFHNSSSFFWPQSLCTYSFLCWTADTLPSSQDRIMPSHTSWLSSESLPGSPYLVHLSSYSLWYHLINFLHDICQNLSLSCSFAYSSALAHIWLLGRYLLDDKGLHRSFFLSCIHSLLIHPASGTYCLSIVCRSSGLQRWQEGIAQQWGSQ